VPQCSNVRGVWFRCSRIGTFGSNAPCHTQYAQRPSADATEEGDP
jgi:hypothetical protein